MEDRRLGREGGLKVIPSLDGGGQEVILTSIQIIIAQSLTVKLPI